jgi:hypothetical protein
VIVAIAPRGRSRPVAITTGAPETVIPPIVIGPCGAIDATVLDRGRPVGGLVVGLGAPEAEADATVTDEHGAFVFAAVPAGPARVRILRPGSLAAAFDAEVDVLAGRTTTLTVDLPDLGRG